MKKHISIIFLLCSSISYSMSPTEEIQKTKINIEVIKIHEDRISFIIDEEFINNQDIQYLRTKFLLAVTQKRLYYVSEKLDEQKSIIVNNSDGLNLLQLESLNNKCQRINELLVLSEEEYIINNVDNFWEIIEEAKNFENYYYDRFVRNNN